MNRKKEMNTYLAVYTIDETQHNYSFISAKNEDEAIDIALNNIQNKNQLTKMLITNLNNVYKVPLENK
jgi:hypothetical protein